EYESIQNIFSDGSRHILTFTEEGTLTSVVGAYDIYFLLPLCLRVGSPPPVRSHRLYYFIRK
ncbi:MAG: hypothetical protein RR214_06585, partial [Synergistaceae bacterium]